LALGVDAPIEWCNQEVPDRPLLVFDGDCAFCRLWVGYWNGLTGERVEYAPWQAAAGRLPDVPRSDFHRAVQYFESGKRYSGAEAVFHLLAKVPGWRWTLWLYQHIPGIAALTEWLYAFVAGHRNAGYKVTRALWGKSVDKPSYRIASSLFSRALALIYCVAFASFGHQIRGLIGAQGILPVTEFLAEAARQFGASRFWQMPTLCWWANTEHALEFIAWGGAALACVAAIIRPHSSGQKTAFAVLFVLYLSIVNGGQIFMGYQWDYLLLEAGFLAIFLNPAYTRVWLFRWLLFRLMLESGAVKLLSGDPSWHSLTALAVHYESQPLPTPVAWYMMQAPLWFHRVSTGSVFFVELILPFLMFGPRRCKQIAALATVVFQILILLTGNYTFFNLLTIALCLFLLDDRSMLRMIGNKQEPRPPGSIKPVRSNRLVSAFLFAFVMVLSLTLVGGMFGIDTPVSLGRALAMVSPFGVVNSYGLFATMTTTRPEISIEGSNDTIEWQPYIFPYKPGPMNRALGWAAPFQPRLDWQMWFAALGTYRENPWLLRFMMRLLQGSPPVLQLIEQNPFPAQPPKYIRAMIYRYRFTDFDERRRTGNWWKRESLGTYFPPVSLRGQ
jgi:predicted DCC family thiol-disulfide oxidoreductase YuxK